MFKDESYIEKSVMYLLQYKQILEVQLRSISKNRKLKRKNEKVISLLEESYIQLFYTLFGIALKECDFIYD